MASKSLRVLAKIMAIRLPLPKFLTTWRIHGSTRGVSCTKTNLARMQRKKALRWWERFTPANGTSFLEKYLKTMETFNLSDLHHLLAMAGWTPKSWWARSEKSSLKVGRMIASRLCFPMIAPNSLRVGHNSTPLNWKTCWVGIQNSVTTRRRGSSTLI